MFLTNVDRYFTCTYNGLFTLPDPDSDYCTMEKFHIGSDSDYDPLIEIYVVGTEICP